jgi:hypothetical protein
MDTDSFATCSHDTEAHRNRKNQEQNIQQTRMKAKNILLTVGMCAGVGLVPLAAQTNEQQATPTPSPMNMMGMNQKQEQSSGMMGMKHMMGEEQMMSNSEGSRCRTRQARRRNE